MGGKNHRVSHRQKSRIAENKQQVGNRGNDGNNKSSGCGCRVFTIQKLKACHRDLRGGRQAICLPESIFTSCGIPT